MGVCVPTGILDLASSGVNCCGPGLSEEDWDLGKEMIGWELGESLVLLPPVLSVEEILNNDLDEK